MAVKALAPTSLRSSSAKAKIECAEACSESREYMKLLDESMRPVLRDDAGCELRDASDGEHGDAHMDHVTHGAELVRFFLQFFGSTHDRGSKGIAIVAYTRFDSMELDPRKQAIVVGHTVDALELELYHSAGRALGGRRYDPIFREEEVVSAGADGSTDGNVATSGDGRERAKSAAVVSQTSAAIGECAVTPPAPPPPHCSRTDRSKRAESAAVAAQARR